MGTGRIYDASVTTVKRFKTRRRRKKATLTGKVNKINKKLKQMVKADLHRLDVIAYSGLVPLQSDILIFQYLTGTAEGDASTNRAGLSIRCLRMQGKIFGTRILNTTNATAIRLLLIRYNQVEAGIVPALDELFEDSNTASFLAWSARGKYQVVLDKVFQLGRTDSGASAYHIEYDYKVPLKYQEITYNGSGSLIGAAEKNHYLAIAFGSDGVDVGITWQSRMIFTP